MFEILKLVWDAIVLRDAARKGQMNWRMSLTAFGFVFLLYAIGVPAGVLYQKGPQYKPVFIAAMILDCLVFIAMIVWALTARRRLMAARVAEATAANSAALHDS